MTNIEKLQKVWDAKDLEGVLGMLTDDVEMRMLHMDQTLKGPEAHAFMKELVLDDSVVSSDFRIIYENNECAVTYERMSGENSGQVSIAQLFRDKKICYMDVSLISDSES